MANASIANPERRAAVLSYIEAYYVRHGYGPTVREVTRGCGMATTSNAAYYIRKLTREGALDYVPRQARSLTLGRRAPLIEDLRALAARLDGHPAQVEAQAILKRLEG